MSKRPRSSKPQAEASPATGPEASYKSPRAAPLTAQNPKLSVSAIGEAWTAMTLRLVQTNVSFAQTLWRTWWAPERSAWLPFGPAQLHLTGHLPTLPLKAMTSTEPHLRANKTPLAVKSAAPVRRRVVLSTKGNGKPKGTHNA
jgi:hypothetical protein